MNGPVPVGASHSTRSAVTWLWAAALAVVALLRVISYDGSGSDALIMAASVVLFVVVQLVLIALRVSDMTRLSAAYFATFYFGNRVLAEVWLGSPLEAAAGTVAPLLLGDVVLLEIIVRRRLLPTAWQYVVAALLLVPAIGVVTAPWFAPDAFFYQYAVLVRLAVVARVVYLLSRRAASAARDSAEVARIAMVFAALGLLTGAVALLTGGRVGLPGWGINVYANALAVVGAVCGWSALYDTRRRWLNVALLAGCLIGIVGTGTRLALVALLVVLAWSTAARLVARRYVVFGYLSVGVVAGVLLIGFIGPILALVGEVNPRFATFGGLEVTSSTRPQEVFAALGNESTFRSRTVLWGASWEMFATHPVSGIGWGQWNWQKAEYGVPFDALLDPHNGYLWALAEGGVIGFVLVYLSVGVVLVYAGPSLATFGVLLALMLEVTNANLQKPLFAVLLAVLLGLAMSHASSRRDRRAAQGDG